MRALRISQLELGIGDIFCSLYALNGFSLARGRPPIELHMRDHFDWPTLVDIPGLSIVRSHTPLASLLRLVRGFDFVLGDTEADYGAKLRSGMDPKLWYARKLGAEPATPALRRELFARPPDWKRPYVVFSPFSTRVNRNWDVGHWRVLAKELAAAGYECVAIDAPGQTGRCGPIGVKYYWGQPVAWVANVCYHAALVITNDSAIAHLGGLLGAPTLVILSQQDPRKHFSMTANHSIVPDEPCVGCRFQPDRGYEPMCNFGCWTLQTISPRLVARRALALLAEGRRTGASSA